MACSTPINLLVQENFWVRLVIFFLFFDLWEFLFICFLKNSRLGARSSIVMSKVCIAFWVHNFDCKIPDRSADMILLDRTKFILSVFCKLSKFKEFQ